MADPSSRGICALAAANKLLSSKHKTDCQAKSNSLAVFLIRQVLPARCVSPAGRGRAKAVRAKSAARLRTIWLNDAARIYNRVFSRTRTVPGGAGHTCLAVRSLSSSGTRSIGKSAITSSRSAKKRAAYAPPFLAFDISQIIRAVISLFRLEANNGEVWRDLAHTTCAVPPSKLSEWAATEGARY